MKNILKGIVGTLAILSFVILTIASVTDTRIELDGLSIYNNNGRFQFDGGGIAVDSIKFKNGGSFPNFLEASATLDFASFSSKGETQDLTISLTGATTSDGVILAFDRAAGISSDNVRYIAFVSSANTVTVRGENGGDGSPDPDPGVFYVYIIK